MSPINKRTQQGFTLVELAIALMIIGLLIGGVLKGIELVENARVTQVVRSVKAYETAIVSFQSIYGAMPGDMGNASARLPNCGATTTCGANAGNADGLVGTTNTAVIKPAAALLNSAVSENRIFWLHLSTAGLITGVDPIGDVAATGSIWGVAYPASPIVASGFDVQYVNTGATTPTGPYPTGARFSGHYVELLAGNGTAAAVTGNQSLQLDTKFDDGNAGTGDIIVSSSTVGADCITGSNYNVDSQAKACVEFFKVAK